MLFRSHSRGRMQTSRARVAVHTQAHERLCGGVTHVLHTHSSAPPRAPGPPNIMGENTQLHAVTRADTPCSSKRLLGAPGSPMYTDAPTAPRSAREQSTRTPGPVPPGPRTGPETPGSQPGSARPRQGPAGETAGQPAGRGAGARWLDWAPPFGCGGGGCRAPWQRPPASCAQEIHGTAGECNWGDIATYALPRRRYQARPGEGGRPH